MRKRLILALLFTALITKAQGSRYDLRIDTVTYKYYLAGDWEKLIDTTKQALKNGIDFKFLRQRIGYAYFVKENYFASQCQYEKALAFDKTDINTRTYLYYCGLHIGNEATTRYWGGRLPDELKNKFNTKPFKIVSSVDLEYNYKANEIATRGDQSYLRGGINSQLGYRLNLYQAFSTYGQQNTSAYIETDKLINVLANDTGLIRQNEYFALLNWGLTSHISLNIGYHYLNSIIHNQNTYSYEIGGTQYKTVNDTAILMPGNMLCSKLTYTINRFDFALSGSILKYDNTITQQYGIHAGALLPGKYNVYLKSALYNIFDTKNSNRLIFSQKAGALFFKKLWVEGNLTLGNLNNFSDHNGLYVYNPLDPTTFRTGLTLFWNVLPKISLFGNYNYDKKLIENSNTNYNQHSFSAGIIWKI